MVLLRASPWCFERRPPHAVPYWAAVATCRGWGQLLHPKCLKRQKQSECLSFLKPEPSAGPSHLPKPVRGMGLQRRSGEFVHSCGHLSEELLTTWLESLILYLLPDGASRWSR